MKANEIRDYIERAPKEYSFNGSQIVNHNATRYQWLADISRGTIHARINRRAAIHELWKPFCNPAHRSYIRWHKRQIRKSGSNWNPY